MHRSGTLTALGVTTAQQVPSIPLQIEEDDHLPVRLLARCAHERHPGGDHPLIRRVEVVDAQEETDPPGELLADRRFLVRLPFAAAFRVMSPIRTGVDKP